MIGCSVPAGWGHLGRLDGAPDTVLSPQELEARVPEGQHLFENLLRLGPARGTSDTLEDLRYQWMLYKSKLKDSRQLLVGAEDTQVPAGDGTRRSPGSPGKPGWARILSARCLHGADRGDHAEGDSRVPGAGWLDVVPLAAP